MAIYSRSSIHNITNRRLQIRKTNALLNLINNQSDIDKIYLYAKDPKHHYLIDKREKVGLDHIDDLKAFMEYSNDMQDVFKNIEDYNPNKKEKY